MTIRPETLRDFAAIFDVNRRAFGRDDEGRLVDALRKSQGYIPDLSLVAEDECVVVGHPNYYPRF